MSSSSVALSRWGFWGSLAFWTAVAWETIAQRRFARVLHWRLRGRLVDVWGVDHVAHDGGLVFAVNHYHAGLTLDVIAAALAAATDARAGISDACTIVIGTRARPAPTRWRRLVRAGADVFLRRWSMNVLRITIGDVQIGQLRAFARRARRAPVLVFPEGVAKGSFVDLRTGAGRWLATLRVPVIPVGVWWDQDRWRVIFGAPITWSAERRLHDVQLGLAIADLLPRDLAPTWQDMLARWRASHAEAS